MKNYLTITSIFAFVVLNASAGTVVNNTYIGGTTDATDFNGDIVNNIGSATESVSFGTYFGGNYYGLNPEQDQLGKVAGDVLGNITNNLTNVTITGHYTGGNGNNEVGSNIENGINIGGITGTITNNIVNSSINGTFYAASLSGGPKSGYETGTIGAVVTNIKNSYVNWICISGGGLISKITGSVNTVIENSNINELYHNSGIFVGGDCNISLKNSNVNTNYFHAAPGAYGGYGDVGIAGNLNVSLSGTSTVKGDIHLGSPSNNATIGGNATVTLTDSAYAEGTIYGREGGNTFGGKVVLNLGTSDSAYVGTNALKVSKFDEVNVAENSSAEFASFDTAVNGNVLNVKGNITTSDKNITISEGGSLNLTLKKSNQIDASVTNNGTFSVTATSNLKDAEYTIITGTLTGNEIKGYGGVVNGNIFTVGEVKAVEINKEAQGVVVSNNGIVTITDSSIPVVETPVVEMAFNANEVTVNKVETIIATESFKESIANINFDVAKAFEFDVEGMNKGDSAVLSFYVGDTTLSAKDFSIFHKAEGGEWSEASDVSGVAYDGTTLSFVVSHFSSYGFTALATIPEPAEWAAIFGAFALGFAIYRRRK